MMVTGSEQTNFPTLFPEIPHRLNELDHIIATSGGDARLRSDIDNAMQTLEDTISRLRSGRNACSPLLRLPLELMSNILYALEEVSPPVIGYSMSDIHDDNHTHGIWTAQLGWLHLSHVCRALRTSILQRGDMWARNIYRFPQIQKEILPRCGNHPLALRLDSASVCEEADGIPMQFVLDNLGRAGSLIVKETHPSLNAWPMDPSGLLRQPLPFLEVLSIRVFHYNEDGRHLTLTSDICDLPPVHAPLLKSLALENYMISFSATTLTTLHISFTVPLYLHTPTQFIEILRSGIHLERLELGNCIPLLGRVGEGESRAGLDMSNLRFLKLDDNIERCLRLWQYFSVSPETDVVIALQDVRQLYPALNSHLEVIPKYFGDWGACSAPGLTVCEHEVDDEDPAHIRDVSVHLCVPSPGARLAHWDGGLFEHGYHERRQLLFDAVDCSESQFVSAIAAAHTITDVSATTALELDGHQSHDASTWSTILAPFPSVETLYVENPGAENLIMALTAAQNEDSPLLLPQLRCLWLHHLEIVEDGEPSGATRAQIVRMAASRARNGAALQCLRVDKLKVVGQIAEQMLVSRLRSLVSSFEYMIVEN